MLKPSQIFRAVQWSKTLNLPKSTFPPRALEAARPKYLQACTDDLYSWQAVERRAEKPFVLHDGPPYANGPLHIGHALNKILKDIICRFEITRGRKVHYRPGWDCHGLPIELKALQQKEGGHALRPAQVREVARKLATKTIEEQRAGFKQWGILGDWDSPYITMDKGFEIEQLKVFKVMVQKGLIYRQFKPVHWSPSSGTALAEAELEYDDQHVSHSAFIKYKLDIVPEALGLKGDRPVYALIWTTTPWTLPANRAIAYHDRIQYCAFQTAEDSGMFLVARSRLTEAIERAGLALDQIQVLADGISGSDLFGSKSVTYNNPFRSDSDHKEQPLLHGDFVTAESGTGLVHLAPGHGPEDYSLCAKHGISAFAPLDDQAKFTSEAYPQDPTLLEGKNIHPEGVHAVLNYLKNQASPAENLVWAEHAYTHRSPIDWRTKKPTIIRATAQWFANVESIKVEALKALEAVRFIPPSGKSRLEGFINGRSQWCISRQRAWGVPIPALYTPEGEAIMTEQSVDHIIKVINERGIDAWWTDAPNDPSWVSPDLPKATYTRGRDTMDVWFDSGTSWTQIPAGENQPPADVYVEGTDQHRGWFQSCLLTYVASQLQDKTTAPAANLPGDRAPTTLAPYKTLMTHGFILDAVGKKMSKSIGNVISPEQIMSGALLPPLKKRKGQGSDTQLDSMGPDALRLWVAMSDYTRDVTVSETILKAVNGSLHKYRVTFKWLLGACADFDTKRSGAAYPHLANMIAANQRHQTQDKVYAAYQSYDFVKAITAINNYVNSDLSAFYFETAKDALYAGDSRHRLRVQKTCFGTLRGLLRMLAPILPLLVTEVLDHASRSLRASLEYIPGTPFLGQRMRLYDDRDRAKAEFRQQAVEPFLQIHQTVKTLQEAARADKHIGTGLETAVELTTDDEGGIDYLKKKMEDCGRTIDHNRGDVYKAEVWRRDALQSDLAEMLVVSQVDFESRKATALLESEGFMRQPRRVEEDPKRQWSYSKDIELDGLKFTITVRSPDNEKCPRCWRWVAPHPSTLQVGPDWQILCKRCLNVKQEKNRQVFQEWSTDIDEWSGDVPEGSDDVEDLTTNA